MGMIRSNSSQMLGDTLTRPFEVTYLARKTVRVWARSSEGAADIAARQDPEFERVEEIRQSPDAEG